MNKRLEKKIISHAISMKKKAYAPYSKFRVGAAILGKSLKIYGGCNIENSSFGLTICAERVSIGTALSCGERKLKGIAIATDSLDFVPPCGACRQVLSEFCDKKFDVILVNKNGMIKEMSIGEIFPFAFQLRNRNE